MDLRSQMDECLILRSREFQEADRLLTVLGRRLGRLSCLARGVRRPNSRLKAATLDFSYSKLQFAPAGRKAANAAGASSGLQLITQGEALDGLPGLREDLSKLGCAYYLGELLILALPENKPQENIFILAVTTLTLLANLTTEQEQFLVLKFFELRLLGELGWRPNLTVCSRCGRPVRLPRISGLPDVFVAAPALGGLACPLCCLDLDWSIGRGKAERPGLSRGCLRLLDSLLNWELRPLLKLRISTELRQEVNACIWAFLDYHLGPGAGKARRNLQVYYDI